METINFVEVATLGRACKQYSFMTLKAQSSQPTLMLRVGAQTKLCLLSVVFSFILEQIIEANVVPQLLSVAIVKGAGHLHGDDEVAVHHNLQAAVLCRQGVS